MRIITIAFICIALQGCATMFDRSPRRVLVASTPPGAEVFVDGDRVGTTPTSVLSDAGSIRLESGVLAQRVQPSPEASPWLWADIPAGLLTGFLGFGLGHRLCDECDLRPKIVPGVFTSLVPIIVDLVSGRAFRYPSRVHVTLAPAIDRVGFSGSGRFGQSRSQQPVRAVQPAAAFSFDMRSRSATSAFERFSTSRSRAISRNVGGSSSMAFSSRRRSSAR